MQYKLEHKQLEEMFVKAISSCKTLGIEAFHYECSKKDSLYLLTLTNTIKTNSDSGNANCLKNGNLIV